MTVFLGGCSVTLAPWGETLSTGSMLVQAGLTALTVLGALLLWERISGRSRQRGQLLRELRYLLHWSAEEGVLRKTGLLRDLNGLGVVPRELERVSLHGAQLDGVLLQGSRLKGADLHGADLRGARLDAADLSGADLEGANLERASLCGAILRDANLDGVSLAKADLSRANLHRASLVDANLHGAKLEDTRLHRARFAARQAGLFHQAVHPSVEDWIRERLDAQGRYQGGEAEPETTETLAGQTDESPS
ncbi:MAG: pentapeptide repeat-containing protein [Deltaproteobacteria bacterium]|nr:pentapeptide repeat-containing protein [Deltaproteobacteria bacterium]